MIHSITIENYQSIKNKTTLNMAVTGNAPQGSKYFDVLGGRASAVSTLIGPNGSGKTTLLKSVAVLNHLISESMTSSMPMRMLYQPFAVDQMKAKKPTMFNVVFGEDDETYDYTVKLFKGRIVHESMNLTTVATVRAASKKIFSRQWFDKSKSYEFSTPGLQFKNIIEKTPEDNLKKTSVIAFASFLGDPVSRKVTSYWDNIKTNIEFSHSVFYGTGEVWSVLSKLDDKSPATEEFMKEVLSYLPTTKEFDFKKGDFIQIDGDKTYAVDINSLSSGTKQLVIILDKLKYVLDHGGVAVIDEFDAYLHPSWLASLVTQFFDHIKNPKGAQLIMSTHSIQIINQLDKYQVNIVENQAGSTEITRLDQIEGVRSVEDFFGNYMGGKYGGVPVTP